MSAEDRGMFEKLILTIDAMLKVGFFFLMSLGLGLSSIFLWFEKIDGTEWVAICGILFAADRLGSAWTSPTKARQQ